jgi:hypothetical protein
VTQSLKKKKGGFGNPILNVPDFFFVKDGNCCASEVVDSKLYLSLDVPQTLGFAAGAHNMNNTDRTLSDM